MSDTDTKNGQAEGAVAPDAGTATADVAAEPVVELEWVAKTELDAAQKELAMSKDKLLRLQADFDNFRRRTAKERDELFIRANESLMTELLTVIDHAELAIGSITGKEGAAPDPLAKGFKMVSDELQSTLSKFGLTPVDALGKTFDANQHESLSQLPSDTVPEGTVLTQVRRGYKLGEKLLRPARVILSSGPAAKTEGAS